MSLIGAAALLLSAVASDDVNWSLELDKKYIGFVRVRVRNDGDKQVLVSKFRYDYEVRVFDPSGRQISNEGAWRMKAELPARKASDLIVLSSSDEISFITMAVNAKGMVNPNQAGIRVRLLRSKDADEASVIFNGAKLRLVWPGPAVGFRPS